MDIIEIEGKTRTLGLGQGYQGLHIRDEPTVDKADGEQRNQMVSQWKPTYEELLLLVNSGVIQLTILGSSHPPVMLSVVAGSRISPIKD